MEDRNLLAVLTDPLIVGGVTSSDASIFARVNEAAAVAIQYSTSSTFSGSQTTVARNATSGSDFTTIVPLQGLLPETKYFYRAVVNGTPINDATVRSFVTYAAPETVAQFSFAVTADLQNINADPTVPAPAYASIAAEDHAFLIQLGDIDHRNPSTLSGMREMHREVRGPGNASGADFARYIAPNLPIVYIWDDHDFTGNNSDKNSSSKPAALQAYKEYYPTVTRPNQDGIWHSFRYGQAEFFMLDVRSQRDPATQPDGVSKSMLDGNDIANDQGTWLKNGLLNSTATWKFIASGVAFNPTTKPADSWGAYGRERQELVDFVKNNGISGVIVLSGDLHSGGAIDDGKNSDFPEMSVPHTNLHSSKFASGPAGYWSEGIDSGAIPGGYATVTVTADQVILETRSANGIVKRSLTIPQQQSTNHSPTVNAGLNQTITLPTNSVALNGTVWDDNFPSNPLTTAWAKNSGPGTVIFASTTSVDTTARFSEPGTYVLRLTADDGEFRVSDDVQIVVNPQFAQSSVTSLALINADTDMPIGSLTSGQTINLANLPTQHLNVRADTIGTVGSVQFGLDAQTSFRAENSAPYSLFGDSNGDYKVGAFSLGSHTLSATPFSQPNLGGTAGTALSISFTVINDSTPINEPPMVIAGVDQTITLPANSVNLDGTVTDDNYPSNPLTTTWSVFGGPGMVTFGNVNSIDTAATFSQPGSYLLRLTANDGQYVRTDDVQVTVNSEVTGPAVTSFTLINSDTDQPLGLLTNGQTINLAEIPTQHLNVRADTAGTVGSVRFGLDANGTYRTESSSPYSLFGDNNGNYNGGSFALGGHTLTATPYSGTRGGGTAGTSLSISFTVINQTIASTVRSIAGVSAASRLNQTAAAPSSAEVLLRRATPSVRASYTTDGAFASVESRFRNGDLAITERVPARRLPWNDAVDLIIDHREKRPAIAPDIADDVLAFAFQSFGV